MKLMNVFLLFGIINNTYSVDHELFLKIKTVWNYFTPETQKDIKKFLHNEDLTSALNQDQSKSIYIVSARII